MTSAGQTDHARAQGFSDRRGLLASASPVRPIALELGCGTKRLHPEAVGVDILDHPEVDVVGDAMAVVESLPDNSVSAVFSNHFLEHIDDPISLVMALGRVVRPGGTVTTVVPYFANQYFYSDPTHRQAWGVYSFSYLADDEMLRRKVPNYFGNRAFELVSVRLIFKSPRPYYVRHAISKAVEKWVNRHSRGVENYEQRWCYAWPCYEVEYVIRRKTA